MKSEIIVITNQKGGVGKSTTAEALAEGLYIKGYNTLLIDLDPQGSVTSSSNANINKKTAYDLLTVTNDTDITDVIQKQTNRADIIPAHEYLSRLDSELTKASRAYRLKKKIEPIKSEYEYIIIDTPGSLSILTINALNAAGSVIIPTQADSYSLDGVEKLYDTIEDIMENMNPSLKLHGILLTRHNRTVLRRNMTESAANIATKIGTFIYGTAIRECVALEEAQRLKQTIYEYAPESNAADDYTAFVNEFIERGGSSG